MQLHIKLGDSLEVSLLGVRRAAGFMALGIRAANDVGVTSLNLQSNFQIQFFPEPMPAAEMETARKEFRAWIIGNGLRELEQHFAIYLDHLYQACLLFSSHGSTLPDDHAGRLKQMQDITSIAGKLRRLAEDFSVSARHAAHFASLSTARNVIAHALGIVRQRDCTGQTALRVSWLGRDFVLAGRTLNGGFEPFRVEEESWLQMKVVERERLFQVGTKVTFSSDDLLEICLMFTDEARALAVAIEDFARSKGVVVNPQASGPLS